MLFELSLWYVALMWVVGAISITFQTRYATTRAAHYENVRRLED